MKTLFYSSGKFIYHARWYLVGLFTILFALCLPHLPRVMSPFKQTGFSDPFSQSAETNKYLDKNLNYRKNRFIIVYQSKKPLKEGMLNDEIHNSLEDVKNFPQKTIILYPSDNKKQISSDKLKAYAVVMLKNNAHLSDAAIKKFKSLIKKPKNLQMLIGGEPVFQSDLQKQTQKDLIQAEYIASPIAVITLLFVFASVTAAFVPMLLDAVCAIFILTALYAWGQLFSLSIFTINIALLLGLCLSLDYALFIINRFREELAKKQPPLEALAITLDTAGKAVFFSGLAVLISLSALFIFPINILFSVGIGGVTAVAMAVLVSVILLPAILAILKHKINFLPVRLFHFSKKTQEGYWSWSVKKVIKHRYIFFILSLLIIACLSYPLLNIKIGVADFRVLPSTQESRKVFDIISNDYDENLLKPITILIKSPQQNFLNKENISSLYRFSKRIARNAKVDEVDSIVDTDPQLNLNQYQSLYTAPMQNTETKKLLTLTTKRNFTVVTVTSKHPTSPEANELINHLRNKKLNNGLKIAVTGAIANTLDVLHRIAKLFPYALLWIIVLTYLILLILLRSLILPIKAIIMNIFSLSASYGVLVYILQEGHFARLLNFDPQPKIDLSLLIIIFCALFGFSMDYEVFLLTRIRECYLLTKDNNQSIVHGIVHSSKIITSAAIIVILICFSFLSADILMVKAFGLGIAVAIFIDAFLIRTILVPATMSILQSWCWYLPRWLARILP